MKKFILTICAAAAALLTMRAQHTETMRTEANSQIVKNVELETGLVVCGGGLAGVCTAVAAARHGTKVILVQDRPMLGGNASSEMRMGIVGVRKDQYQEAGILEEMQLRNFRYNPLLRYTIWDDVILTTVISEPNIKLLLNTSVEDVVMDGDSIAAVKAWNSNAYTNYLIKGQLFADCTGDGILRLSGAKFRRGRELPSEFNEDFLETGGNYDTIFDAPDIQFELKRIAYGVWEYIKNNPDGRGKGYELDWIGSLPGKRESTRFIGPHILTQNDVLSGGHFEDVVAYGGLR